MEMTPGLDALTKIKPLLLTLFMAGSSVALPAGQAPAPTAKQAPAAASRSARGSATGRPVHYTPTRFSKRATIYFESLWGIDSLAVRAAESGEIIRFSYRVLDPDKAAQLNDKKSEPLLYDQRARVQLVVPSLEKVGKLRQSSSPITGKSYWMAFSNPGRNVKPGDHVSVVIGKFRAEGLLVE